MRESKFFSRYFFIALGLSSYPVTLLFASNFQNTRFIMYLIPLVIVYLFATCVYILFYTFRNKCSFQNIHLNASIVTIIFFIYGIYYHYLLNSGHAFFAAIARIRFLLPITVILLFGVFYLINKLENFSITYKFILVFLITLNTLPFLSIVKNVVFTSKKEIATVPLKKKNSNKYVLPNIYYIILDGYGGNGSMKKILDYDNSNFTNQLEEVGFKVQENANSNYNRTLFSLTSTLNLNYIQNIVKKNIYHDDVNFLLKNNKVTETLKSYGYTYYLFDSGYGLKDEYAKNEILIKTKESSKLKEFIFSTSDDDVLNAFIKDSFLYFYPSLIPARISLMNYAKKILNVFDKLPQIAKVSNRKFVFAHIISPHPPFLFDELGNYRPTFLEWNSKSHIGQLKFINRKILTVVKEIIKNDKGNKIIIVQGDHGSRILPVTKVLNANQKWVQEEYSILNAIYISKNDKLKESIYNNWKYSSVNTFRFILNEYFQYKLPMLENDKYHIEMKEPYEFVKIK